MTSQINSMSIASQKKHSLQNIQMHPHKFEQELPSISPESKTTRQRVSSPSIFISKTFQILEVYKFSIQNQQFEHIVRWNPDGTTFIIDDIEQFQKEVLPVYFRHRNYTSFVRQLNMYDFHKIRNEANRNIFQHKQFQRHFREGLKKIKRKGCNVKKVTNENSNPEKQQLSFPEPIKSHKTVVNSKGHFEGSESYIPKICSYTASHRRVFQQNKSNICSSTSNSPLKRKLIEEFIENLPESVSNEGEIQDILREMKRNPKYESLNSKEDMKKIVKKIKKLKFPKLSEYDLDDLSIQEDILVENVNGPTLHNPSLAIFMTEKCLPMRSQSLIGSLDFADDVENMLYPH